MLKKHLSLLIALVSLVSCNRYIPLIVSNPEVPQGNVVTKANQITGSFNLTSSTASQGEQTKNSFNTVVDTKYSITNKIFAEGSFLLQKETVTHDRQIFRASGALSDTVSGSNIYNNNAFTIGAGYYKELGNNSNWYFSVAGGYMQHGFSVLQESKLNSDPEIRADIDFTQKGIYISPSFQYVVKKVAVVMGLKQNFYNIRNVQYQGSSRSGDALLAIQEKIQTPTQLYFNLLIAPTEAPLALRIGFATNLHSLPITLQSRAFAAAVGIAYYPFERKKK